MGRLFHAASFSPAIIFPLGAMLIVLRNQPLLNIAVISHSFLLFLVFLLLPGVFVILRSRSKAECATDPLPGLFLWSLFSAGYFLLASLLNRPNLNTNNIYFAADSWSWYLRMGASDGWHTGMRAIHPFAMLVFRPVVVLISMFTFGDRFAANLALLALTGGGCVFLMWKFVKDISKNEVYAILFATLLGISAAHLIFASVVESYIFSACVLLLFLWLLLSYKPIYLLVAASLLTCGITLTNVVQQALIFFAVRRKFKSVVLVFATVILWAAGLNIISRFIYPVTEYFFLPENVAGEQRFAQTIDGKRVVLMAENLLVYNVVAPQPYSSIRNAMPRFNFLNGAIQDYAWFGWPAFLLWMSALSVSVFHFFRNLRSGAAGQALPLALLGCLAFNFLLHLGYGAEPFLYTADWTYALISFVALSLSHFSKHVWFQVALFGSVTFVLLNNLWLMYLIARQVSQYLG